MSKKHPSQEELMKKLKTPGPSLQTQPVKKVGPPLAEQGIVVELDELRPYDRNPRTLRNPKYEEIKESIREVGLKHAPVVTQRPGDDKYMISDGGNTRLQILRELYEETGDKRFRKFHCIYRPWVSEAHILAGHLSENETRGDLSWIEKSLGTQQLKETLEAEAGKTLSQRELAKRAKELGFALNQGHISRMLYTVEHFWPTLPMTLESGMGKDQVQKLINYREACLLIWRRCDAKPEEDFGPAWHETMSYFDHEGQTVLPWSIVEDRLLGMLEDATGAHLNPIDYALRTILDFRKRRWSLEEHDEDIWRPLDVEMERVRDPDAHPLTYFPPLPGEEEKGESGRRGATAKPSQPQGPTPVSPSPSVGQGDGKMDDPGQQEDDEQPEVTSQRKLEELRQQVERLQQENASLQSQPSSLHTAPDANVDDGTELPLSSAGPPEPLSDMERQYRLDALSLGDSQDSGETESFRRTREWLSRQQGEEPVNFEDNALRAVPLRSAEPIYPVMDIWAIEPAFRDADRMRTEIGYFAVALARWAGINQAGEHQAVFPQRNQGLGYSLEPLSDEQAQSRRAQRVWQLLAGLNGEVNPAYPTDVTLMGELLGTASDNDIMPDEILVRFYRMVRLMRALRAQLSEGGDDS